MNDYEQKIEQDEELRACLRSICSCDEFKWQQQPDGTWKCESCREEWSET